MTIIHNSSNEEHTKGLNVDSFKIWVSQTSDRLITAPTTLWIHATPDQLQKLNLQLFRVVGKVECPGCENHRHDVLDTIFGAQSLNASNQEVRIDRPGMYYITGDRDTSPALFSKQSLCQPIIIETADTFTRPYSC